MMFIGPIVVFQKRGDVRLREVLHQVDRRLLARSEEFSTLLLAVITP
jgi:hypothetical protein